MVFIVFCKHTKAETGSLMSHDGPHETHHTCIVSWMSLLLGETYFNQNAWIKLPNLLQNNSIVAQLADTKLTLE